MVHSVETPKEVVIESREVVRDILCLAYRRLSYRSPSWSHRWSGCRGRSGMNKGTGGESKPQFSGMSRCGGIVDKASTTTQCGISSVSSIADLHRAARISNHDGLPTERVLSEQRALKGFIVIPR